ncbi:hypothetical protein BVC80_1787g217 [Macleaya cordata]|uniref:Uncharacterized protein n=1 Tax=Macleaya cordata TaxID=56857 RepID=A0A200QUI7_MACCD|nr:hypothetical protein BVC80_1787g217 [Macleaya cordata]
MEVQGTIDDLCGLWTNEKHVNFLNWMEDSFVRTMLENNDNNRRSSVLTYASTGHRVAPLDRYLPDSSESTRDLRHNNKNRTTKTKQFSDQNTTTTSSAITEDEMMKTCRSSQPFDAEDQVVPQIRNIKGDKVQEEERERYDVAVPPNNNNNNNNR